MSPASESFGRTQPPTDGTAPTDIFTARPFRCTMVDSRSNPLVLWKWDQRTGSPACRRTSTFTPLLRYSTSSGCITESVTNCSGIDRWAIISGVNTVPSGTSRPTTSTGTRFHPFWMSCSVFFIAPHATAPASAPRTNAINRGSLPFDMAPCSLSGLDCTVGPLPLRRSPI